MTTDAAAGPVPHHGPEARADVMEHRWRAALEQLQATRDRLADLEVYAAELRVLLTQGWNDNVRSDPRSRRELTERVRAALQTDPPARGRAILEELASLREENKQLRIAVLDLGAAQEESGG